MSVTISGIPIVDLPDLGAVTDSTSVVAEHAGSGRVTAPAMRSYVQSGMASAAQLTALSARSYGALGDGVNDDTAELQAAIDAATAAQMPLFIPPGRYLISAPLNIQRAVRICGAGSEPYTYQFSLSPATGANGTWIVLDGTNLVSVFNIAPAGTADDNNQVFGVEISHLGILHTHTPPAPGWVPANYPAAIKFGGVSQVYIHDLVLMNPRVAFEATGTNQGSATIERVRGQPLYAAIIADRVLDIWRVRDCHWWCFWSLDTNVLTWQKTNGWLYRLGRMDNPIFSGNFAIWYAGGFLVAATTGTSGGALNKALVSDCMFDTVGQLVSCTDGVGGHNIMFVNTVAYSDPTFQYTSGVLVGGATPGVILIFVNCAIMNYYRSCVEVASTGANNKVRLTGGSLIQSWDQGSTGQAALFASAGNSVIADSSCSFNSSIIGGGFVAGPGQVVRESMTAHSTVFVPAANTATTVAHGLGAVPSGAMLTLRSSLGLAHLIYIDTLTATSATIRTDVAPGGVVTVDILWVLDAEL
jgi:Pectate lyase superfamily protein